MSAMTSIHSPSVVANASDHAPASVGCMQTDGFASSRAELGIARAADKADAANPGWCDAACEALRRFAARGVYAEFTMEMARRWLASDLPAPTDGRAWGRVTRMARDRGYIEQTGGYWPADSSNGAPKRVYRKGAKA